ncbi:MAG TPA: Gfo/Idh/MocA family oxidoreductase [Verrucomicrobiae bacterium]|jgi:predicted dehydrogenase|nr:Gfo/Idh/MocA family oxidoreductase [Verrucomicrobiae bacterium]
MKGAVGAEARSGGGTNGTEAFLRFRLLEDAQIWQTDFVAGTKSNSNTTNKIRVAVLGVGSLGQHHARIYAEMHNAGEVVLAGIYDANPDTAGKVAAKHQTRIFRSISEAAENSDAINIATPTSTHFEIAKQLLPHGRHIFVEKPMTDDTAQAAELIRLAQENKCVLQVGHVERFNPVFTYLEAAAPEPRFIECLRLSPFPARSTDIGVVLDLMIHDLDVVLAFVKSPVTSVDAVGIPVLSKSEDIANARLRFANGCVANLTVSRVSRKRMREIRVFSGGKSTPSYISLDYRAQEGFIYRVARDGEHESSTLAKLLALAGSHVSIVSEFGGRKVVREPVPIEKDEPLKLELQHFVQCVREQQTPMVSGESAKRALDLAFEITRQVEKANGEAVSQLGVNPLKI